MKEIQLFPAAFPDETDRPGPANTAKPPVETIYIGGGTPSLLSQDEIDRVLMQIKNNFAVTADAEITLEANPDDISETKLLEWKLSGINRLSIGVQSFFEEDLKWMNRAHNARQATEALELATRHFSNITMDLIYGTPGLTDEKWKYNVDKALALGIPHLSCYALTVEPSTPLQKLISQHKLEDVDPDKQSAQFMMLMLWLKEAGYEHYEISNFAKPGFRSRHNSSYWQGKPYYGFGPSAHSFNGSERWWNIANNNTYITSISNNQVPFEKEILTPVQRFNEYVMISLRTDEGMDIQRIRKNEWEFSAAELALVLASIDSTVAQYAGSGVLEVNGETVRLTNAGKLLADGIAADFFAD